MNVTAAVYLRVSTDEQTVENQRAPLVRLCEARGWSPRFFEEVESAAKRRPVFEAMMDAAHRGEVRAVVVTALDRLGRSLSGVVDTVQKLDALNCPIVAERDTWLDTSGPHRMLLVSVFAWVAEYERRVLIDRTHAGIARARRQGKRFGRPPLEQKDPEAWRRLVTAADDVRSRRLSAAHAAKRHRVSERTLRRHLAATAKGAVAVVPPADAYTGG